MNTSAWKWKMSVLAVLVTTLLRAESRPEVVNAMDAWRMMNTREKVRESMKDVQSATVDILNRPLLDREGERTGHRQVQRYLSPRIASFSPPDTIRAWEAASGTLRKQALAIVLRGIPPEHVERKGVLVRQGTIEQSGYVIEKVTFEGFPPGVTVPALLYRPKNLPADARVPVVLNPVGHFAEGMTRVEEQIRCINLAKRGMLALSFDWIGFGQLRLPEDGHNPHNELAWLELCGWNGAGVMYMSARRALDALLAHPNADPARVAVTGLSGGGWQTILLAALDERVTLAAPNAGYVDIRTRVRDSIESTLGIGDKEQHPVDLARVADYSHLTALVYPRPLLLIYNERDICFDPVDAEKTLLKPVQALYSLAGQADRVAMHVNVRPGTHNYEADNRRAFYRFVASHFFPGEELSDEELHAEEEVLSEEALRVPLPEDALKGSDAWAAAAGEWMATLPRQPPPPEDSEALTAWRLDLRDRLREAIRFHPVEGAIVEEKPVPSASAGYTAGSFVARIGKDWELPGYVFTPPDPTGTMLYFNDIGKHHSSPAAWGLLRARQRVVCVDLVFSGEMNARDHGRFRGIPNSSMITMMDGVGERALGVRVTQIVALRHAAFEKWGGPITLWAHGQEVAVAALLAAGLTGSEDRLVTRTLPDSLKSAIQERRQYGDDTTLFCPYLLETADIPEMLRLLPEETFHKKAPREMSLF